MISVAVLPLLDFCLFCFVLFLFLFLFFVVVLFAKERERERERGGEVGVGGRPGWTLLEQVQEN